MDPNGPNKRLQSAKITKILAIENNWETSILPVLDFIFLDNNKSKNIDKNP